MSSTTNRDTPWRPDPDAPTPPATAPAMWPLSAAGPIVARPDRSSTNGGPTAMRASTAPDQLIDTYLRGFEVAITERLVIHADPGRVFDAARNLDFMTVRTPLLSAAFLLRGLPSRLSGRSVPPPPQLRLASGDPGLPGWVYLGERPGTELVFGAVGKFWQPNIEWRDVPADDFAGFSEPGWGKIACAFRVDDIGAGRCCLTYECRTATTDTRSAKLMGRYWWLIRPFVGHIMRAALRTVAAGIPGERSAHAATAVHLGAEDR